MLFRSLISIFAALLLITSAANAQLSDLIGLWSAEGSDIQIEFLDDGTYEMSGLTGLEVEEVTGRFVVPPDGDRIVVRLNELGKGGVLTLVEGGEGLTLANDELFGGELTFTRPTNIWLQLGTNPVPLVLLTIIVFGGAALMTGQALASGWQPLWKCIPYGILLALGDRFLNYGLYQGPLLSVPGFLLSAVILVALCIIGHAIVRANKMTTQYPWLYQRKGLFGWRQVGPTAGSSDGHSNG